jgi:DNA repair protein RadC
MPLSSPPKPSLVDLWLSAEKPRERLLKNGGRQLTSVELIAVCLGCGGPGEDVLSRAQRLLLEFGSVDALLAAPPARLLSCHGLGTAKVALLKAVHELAMRREELHLTQPQALTDVTAVSRYLRRRIGFAEREVFGCLYLDTRHRPICWEELFMGSLNRAHVHSREVLKRGIEVNAAALILGHNHPSGVAEPSQADLNLTRELKDLLARVDITVLDHIVVTSDACVSMASRGLLVG